MFKKLKNPLKVLALPIALYFCGSTDIIEHIKDQKDSSYGDISVFIRVSNSKGWIGEVV